MALAEDQQVGDEVRMAIDLWLSGDDRLSLPELAKLARQGDSNARLLLGRIETMDKGPSPYRLSLTVNESHVLFKSNEGKGRFRSSWLVIEAQSGNPRAIALLRSRYPYADPDLIRALHDLGEHEASDHPTRILALYGENKAKQVLLESGYILTDLHPYFAYLMGDPEPQGDGLAALRSMAGKHSDKVTAEGSDALAMAGILALGYGYGDIKRSNKWRPTVLQWLLNSASTRPIADLCRTKCPDQVADCAFALMVLSGGYYETIRLDTPVETIIPQAEFLSSPRARIMTLRRAALTRAETNTELASIPEIASMSSCIAKHIDLERQKYE